MTCCQANSDEEGLYGTETGKKEEREAGSHATDKQDLAKRFFSPAGSRTRVARVHQKGVLSERRIY